MAKQRKNYNKGGIYHKKSTFNRNMFTDFPEWLAAKI